ncbi:MAG: cytochrome b, partial [Pseudomonadota bacterium]
NHAAPRIRVYGTVLAALGCLAVFAWFLYILQMGVMDDPRKNYVSTPFDPIKPELIWIQALMSLGAGLFLLRAAVWQSKRTDQLALPVVNTENKFGKMSRYLHWITALLFISLIPLGIFTTLIPLDAPYRQGYYVLHKTIGFTVLGLLLVRLVWHMRTPTPKLDANLTTWEHRLAKVMHYGLYFLMIAVPVSGYMMSTYSGNLSHFFIWDTPMLFEKNLETVKIWGLTHKVILPFITYIVIGAHVLGALKHHFIDKHHESIHRMVS